MHTTTPEQTINVKALTWTVIVHVLLLLLFLLIHYTLPAAVPPVQDMGMEVNLGTSDNGSGSDQPMSTEDPADNAANVKYKTAASQHTEAKDMMQTADEDAPAVAPPSDKKNTASNNVLDNNSRNKDARQQQDDNKRHEQPKYVYNGATGKGGNGAMQDMPGTSEGNTTGNGDRGVPNGTPGATNYTGSPGSGNGGISHTLSGRRISPDRFEAAFHEGGTVVISVTVDGNGRIINKRIVSSPSRELSNIALQKLSQAKFSPNPDVPEQFGKVTIVFKTRS